MKVNFSSLSQSGELFLFHKVLKIVNGLILTTLDFFFFKLGCRGGEEKESITQLCPQTHSVH